MGNSNNYKETNIQVLKGLDAVRKRPGMYIGSTDSRGLHHLVYEVVDNSIDEAMAGYCDKITVEISQEGYITVTDNGRGIPVGIIQSEGKSAVEVVLTKLHAGGKFGGGGYKYSGGLHGVGVSVVNALSEWLEVEVHQDGTLYKQIYNRGIAQAPLKPVGTTEITGTRMRFYPDEEIFETLDFEYSILKNRLRELAFLNKDILIKLTDKREDREREEDFHYSGGIIEYVNSIAKENSLLDETLHFENIQDDHEIEVAMLYTSSYSEIINGYANNINTIEGGVHIDGFKYALTRLFNEYGQKLSILKEKDKLSGDDVREGLIAVISVKLLDPQFEGQTKTKLGNSFMRKAVSDLVLEKIGTYFEENPKIAKSLIGKSIDAKAARDAARKARNLMREKSNLGSNFIGKLVDCTGKDRSKNEIYLVEGDSAGGSAKQGRDRTFQAILPLRGKILNVQKARIDKVLSNEEIKSMISAFGCNIGEEFDVEKLRYNKIICMTDADVDGSHIRILILTLFFRYMRPLIENGHVYIAQPPLYKVTIGKNEKYLYSDRELEEYIVDKEKKYTIQRYKGLGEMNAIQLWDTTMDPEHRTLLRVKMEDAIEADEIFNILMGDSPEKRREFIEENATLVKDLDI